MNASTRQAASVIPFRRRDELEVYLVQRSPELAFFGGYHVFPGGSVEDGDDTLPLLGGGIDDSTERAALGCAVRELLEEVGILLARGGEGVTVETLRASLVDGQSAADFFRELRGAGFVVDGNVLQPAGRLVTPRFSPVRFDTRFYVVETSEAPEVLPGELVTGAWWTPSAALDAWRRGKLLLSPPTLLFIEHLERFDLETALLELRGLAPEFEGSGQSIRWCPGVELVPLVSPPLPPSIPVNVILLGGARFVIVDPGPGRERERAHLFEVVDRRLGAGDRAEAVVLTHHHIDHVGSLEETLERYRLPLWAHPRTGALLERSLDRELDDGDWIDLGDSLDGRAGWGVRCLFTPGHAEGHIALHDERHGGLIAGDLVSTIVSMYVGSPGGHLGSYFHSLERLRGLPVEFLYPSHGAPTRNPDELIDATLRHRRDRIEQVYRALPPERVSVEALASRVYHDADSRLRPLFERATRAALEFLVEGGRAASLGDDEFARS